MDCLAYDLDQAAAGMSQASLDRRISHREELRDAWESLLGRQQWQYALTLTFDPAHVPDTASRSAAFCNKTFRRLIRHINDSLYGRRWSSRPRHRCASWAYICEAHGDGRLHMHALLATPSRSPEALTQRDICTWWHARYGLASCDPPHSQLAAVRYLVKSLRKGPVADVELSWNFLSVN